MLNSTLIITLRLLNAEERQMLDVFIASPIFKLSNRHQDAVALNRYLKPFAPDFADAERLDRGIVAQTLFHKRVNPESELRKAMSNLLNIVKKLILFQSIALAGSDKTNGENPVETLSAARAELATLHFYSKRLNTLTPQKNARKPPPLLPDQPKRKVKHPEDLVEQIYASIKNKIGLPSETSGPTHNEWQSHTQRQYIERLLINLLVENEWYNHRLVSNQSSGLQLLETLKALDVFYYYFKSDLLLSLKLDQAISNTFQDDPMANEIAQKHLQDADEFLDKQFWLKDDFPALELYQNAFEMLRYLGQPQGQMAFETLKQLLQRNDWPIPREQIKGLKAVLRTFCVSMYHQTKSIHHLQNRFDLFREHIEEEMLFQNQGLPAVQFSGLISDALRLGPQNQTWVQTFLQQFENGKKLMATETPNEVYKINRANLLFHLGQYKEASNELIAYEWYGRVDEPQILLLAIRIDLKTQFELKRLDDDYGLRTIDAAEKRIARLPELDEILKKMTLNFVRLIKQIFASFRRCESGKKKPDQSFNLSAKVKAFQTSISTQPMAEKEWLQEKITQLEQHLSR